MKKNILILFIATMFLPSCVYKTASIPSDNEARMQFLKYLNEMYEIDGLTDHFPPSWDLKNKFGEKWNSRYVSCYDDSLYHNFYCSAVYSDSVSVYDIDAIDDTLHYMRKFLFEDDSSYRVNVIYMDDPQSYKQLSFDTINSPIYDFMDADFMLGTTIDSLFNDRYNYYAKLEYAILPSDLEVYVVDARAGNFWKNRELSSLEPRPVLPDKWKHGYSRGIGVSRECKMACWWLIVW